ncbi:SLAC1 anion channel family protein, partial [Arhodomonas sp. KWT]
MKALAPGPGDRLGHFPVSMFAIVMGLAGLAIAWERAARVTGVPAAVAPVLATSVAAVFIVLLGVYAAKLLRRRADVLAELHHPVKLSFFPTISISLVLLGTLALVHAPAVAPWLWGAGAAAQLAFTLYIVGAWLHQERFEIVHVSPAWFIPAVGNILVPIAGVPLGLAELSWFFFSVGVMFWLVLLTIVVYRMIFHQPLPATLMPTLFILVAPPAVGFVAYVQLTGGVDAFARVLFHTGLFLLLLLLTQWRRFTRLRFAISWWAYSFPLAAMTVAAFGLHASDSRSWVLVLACALLALVTAVVAGLIVRTG